jgi:spore coat protein A
MQMPRPEVQKPVAQASPLKPMLHSLELPPFVDELALPQRVRPAPGKRKGQPGTLTLAMREVHAKVHRDVGPSRFWTYTASSGSTGALAPLIEVRAHQPVEIEWQNQLPMKHFLPVDYTLHGCGHDLPEVRAIAHVHGARVRSKDDGYPEDWFAVGASRRCLYPLEQDATALWYHDHAMGLNRLNIYAGLYGMLVIRDAQEEALHLPAGAYELPLMLCDRDFTADGQLFYPSSPEPEHPWVPEFLADAILVNGKVRPFVNVEPRMYRLRVANVANSRFFALSVAGPKPKTGPAITTSLSFQQIGTDQGLLAAPVTMTRLTLAPAERADLLVDFSGHAGQTLHLLNAAFEIVEFRVGSAAAGTAAKFSLPARLREVERTPEKSATVTRTILLNEYQDKIGNPMIMLLNRKRWHEPVTERPKLNSTEIWEFVNLTEDVHPMHLHLVRFQLLDRQVLDVFAYINRRELKFLSPAAGPEANEAGWKDVIQCPPGMITRIVVRFEGYTGRYLYHCHILEHESNDMMRPFEVV